MFKFAKFMLINYFHRSRLRERSIWDVRARDETHEIKNSKIQSDRAKHDGKNNGENEILVDSTMAWIKYVHNNYCNTTITKRYYMQSWKIHTHRIYTVAQMEVNCHELANTHKQTHRQIITILWWTIAHNTRTKFNINKNFFAIEQHSHTERERVSM